MNQAKLREIDEQIAATDLILADLHERLKKTPAQQQFNDDPERFPWPKDANVFSAFLDEDAYIGSEETIIEPILNNLAGILVHKNIGVERIVDFMHGPCTSKDERNTYVFNLRYN